jgi:hypothetical protein
MICRMNTCSVQACHEHVFESPLGLVPPQPASSLSHHRAPRMATILSVDAAHDDGEFPPLTSEQGDRIAALLRTPSNRAGDLA